VIRDEPADLVEGEPVDPLRPGDRIVVSGPRERLADVTQRLAGWITASLRLLPVALDQRPGARQRFPVGQEQNGVAGVQDR
jgi:hypothetical protein